MEQVKITYKDEHRTINVTVDMDKDGNGTINFKANPSIKIQDCYPDPTGMYTEFVNLFLNHYTDNQKEQVIQMKKLETPVK